MPISSCDRCRHCLTSMGHCQRHVYEYNFTSPVQFGKIIRVMYFKVVTDKNAFDLNMRCLTYPFYHKSAFPRNFKINFLFKSIAHSLSSASRPSHIQKHVNAHTYMTIAYASNERLREMLRKVLYIQRKHTSNYQFINCRCDLSRALNLKKEYPRGCFPCQLRLSSKALHELHKLLYIEN